MSHPRTPALGSVVVLLVTPVGESSAFPQLTVTVP